MISQKGRMTNHAAIAWSASTPKRSKNFVGILPERVQHVVHHTGPDVRVGHAEHQVAQPEQADDDRKMDRGAQHVHELDDRLVQLEEDPGQEAEERRRAEDGEQRQRAPDGERQRDLLRGDALGQLRGDRVDHMALPRRAHGRPDFWLGGFVHQMQTIR